MCIYLLYIRTRFNQQSRIIRKHVDKAVNRYHRFIVYTVNFTGKI